MREEPRAGNLTDCKGTDYSANAVAGAHALRLDAKPRERGRGLSICNACASLARHKRGNLVDITPALPCHHPLGRERSRYVWRRMNEIWQLMVPATAAIATRLRPSTQASCRVILIEF